MTVASAACLGQARATAALRPRRGAGCRAWERTARRVVTADADARVSDATRVVRLDGLGHVPHEEDPAVSLEPVRAFLAQQD